MSGVAVRFKTRLNFYHSFKSDLNSHVSSATSVILSAIVASTFFTHLSVKDRFQKATNSFERRLVNP